MCSASAAGLHAQMTFTAAQNAVHSIFDARDVGARLAAAREGSRLPQGAHRPHSAAEQGVRMPAHMLFRECLCKLHQQRVLMCCGLGCTVSKLGTSHSLSCFAVMREPTALAVSPRMGIHRRVHSEPTLDYSLFMESTHTAPNGHRCFALRIPISLHATLLPTL